MKEQTHLSRGGVDLVLALVDGALVIAHWGAAVGKLTTSISATRERSISNSAFDSRQFSGVMREQSRGWLGNPAISGHRNGKFWSTKIEVSNIVASSDHVEVVLLDSQVQLEINLRFNLDEYGVLTQVNSVKNIGSDSYTLNNFAYWLPLPDRASQTLDFAGRWSNERNPQRRDIATGLWVRDSHEGRSGHNFTIAEIALTENTNFASGEAWAISLAWSGNSQFMVERIWDRTQSIGASEILLPGEVILQPNEKYEAPALKAVYSKSGLDGISEKFHSHIRARSVHPKKARPLTLNMWEAIYFDHDARKINAIAEVAAEIGVERLVLDDGWFGARRSDRAGLGDWIVNKEVWPNGLTSIISDIHDKGMEFGLWFEGEMVNQDSDLYRAHPDWVLNTGGHSENNWRHELVLDLTNAAAFSHVLEQVSAVLTEFPIDYIKWDHNRVVVDASHNLQAAVRNQTLAIYRLFSELKKRHPKLEIESCASGGGRVDLGVIDYVDRFWVSDNNDALERQRNQRWTGQIIPPELLGTHIGPTPGHQTGRSLSLSFRATTALFGHAGIEWDISKISSDDKTALKTWAAYYKANRDLLHTGKSIRIDYADENAYLYGVIDKKRERAIFSFTQLTPTIAVHPAQLTFRDLNPDKDYQVKAVYPAGAPLFMLIEPPTWLTGVTLSGAVLMEIGLPAPILAPENALLIEINQSN
jgi:alpha-galactosidase